MARMLYQRDSASFMLNAGRRHVRLCGKNPNGDPLKQAILSATNALTGKVDLLKVAELNREDAYDDTQLADYDLDNTIRDVHGSCTTYDNKHIGEQVTNKVFPGGKFSEIIRMSYADEPNEADVIAVKIESLGNTHELYPQAALIRTATASVREKIEAYKAAIRAEKAAEAEVEIAKIDMIRAYENNYLDARKQFGANFAERYFPVINTRAKKENNEEAKSSSAS